jgi:hypothetical protein
MHRFFRSLPVPPALLLAALALPCLLAGPVQAGKRDYVDAQYGFEIQLPVKGGWSQTPTQPGERIEVAKFKDDRDRDFSELSIYRFANEVGPGPTTPGEEPGGEAPQIPRMPQMPYGGRGQPDNAVDYLDALVGRAARWYGVEWEGLPPPEKKKFGKVLGDIYEIEFEHAERKGYRVGILAGIVADDDEEYLILFQIPNKLKKVVIPWTKSVRSFRFPEEGYTRTQEDIEEDLEDRDKTRKVDGELLDPEKRARVKARLEGTWRFIDTPHYLVIYNCDDGLAKYIAERVEYMREYAFETVFPPVAPIEACMIVRVCKEMDEYYHYGAPRGSAGYWSSGDDELVFPDLSQSKKPDPMTIGVMHHEAFHQYIHYALLENNLPIWFNEGFAEYFYCVEGKGKKLKFNERHGMRYGVVKSALGEGKLIPLKDFIKMNQRQYYSQASLCYAQGWAFATWMKNVTKNERYQQIPEIMFREMQQGYLDLRGGDATGRGMGRGMWGEYNDVVKAAMDKAFEGIDIEELEKEFHKDLKRKM